MGLPIILTHYGNVDYLHLTLRCATLTNSAAKRILVGDESNRQVALRNGWSHIDMSEIDSGLRQRFVQSFRHIQGKKHKHIKNGRDWLKYVFERWFIVEAFCRLNGIERFWHFDSDVLLLEKLEQYEDHLVSRYAFTRQCNDTCLNGLVSLEVLADYLEYTIALFGNEDFLLAQQVEFDSVHPHYAFTEMRAFEYYSKSNKCIRKGTHLEGVIDGVWFDDCICQSDGFDVSPLCFGGPLVKKTYFSDGKFYGCRKGEVVKFATINLSWVPTTCFKWFLQKVEQRESEAGTVVWMSDELKVPIWYRLKRALRKVLVISKLYGPKLC